MSELSGKDAMKLQKLYSYTRQAIQDFNMIEEGDKIAVGISGGKDSLALLYSLAGLRNFYPKKFSIIAVTVDLGFGNFDLTEIKKLCAELEVEYHIEKTQIAEILKQKISKGTYCSFCAKLRKGALNSFAKNVGCNKIAYAHHKDDMVETMMLSLIYEGQFFSFAPVMYYREADLTVIRPLIYATECELKCFKEKYNLPVVKNPCPNDGITRREYIKNLVNKINRENRGAKDKMFNAILKGKIYEY